MIRYAVSFPGHVSSEMAQRVRTMLTEVADARRAIDVVLAEGATLTRLTPEHPTRAFLSRARAQVR